MFVATTTGERPLFRIGDDGTLPLAAASDGDLRAELTEKGWLLPLPDESAALSNLFETEILDIVHGALDGEDVTIRKGGSRSYPDFEIEGPQKESYRREPIEFGWPHQYNLERCT